jgi:voltage-gated potassium channel
MIQPSDKAVQQFEEATKWLMLALAVAIIPLLVIPLVVDLSPAQRTVITTLDYAIWAIFGVEYFIRLYLTPGGKRRRFMKRNWLDLVLVVVPFLRPLRVFRAVRLLRLLRVATALLFIARAIKASRRALLRHGLAYVLLIAILVTVGGAIVVHEVEMGHPDSKIQSWGSAAWWTVETVATAGSETPWPASSEGQVLRVVLVLIGLALFGFFAASLASWFVEVEEERHEEGRHRDLEARLDRLQETLDALLAERRGEES